MSTDDPTSLLQAEDVVDLRNMIRKQISTLRVDEHVKYLLQQAKVRGEYILHLLN